MGIKEVHDLVIKTLDLDYLSTIKRDRNYIDARYIYVKLCKMLSHESHTDIADYINRSHCLVTHYLRQFDFNMYDKKFRDKFIKCMSKLDKSDLNYIKFNYPKLYDVYLKNEYSRQINDVLETMSGHDIEYFYKTAIHGRR